MTDPNIPKRGNQQTPIAQAESPVPQRGIEIVALLLGLVWIVGSIAYVLLMPSGEGAEPMGFMATIMLIFLPVVVIWLVATTMRTMRDLRAEAARLQYAVDTMRASYLQLQDQSSRGAESSSGKRRSNEPPARQQQPAVNMFTSRREGVAHIPPASRKKMVQAPAPEVDQPALALGDHPDDIRPPLATEDFIRAMQFPENPEDQEGFRSLRLALQDRTIAKMIRSAQDVLTLLSEDGIYMDDLPPDPARADIWRRFAAGERGPGIAALGGIRDRNALALTATRMREDPVFRDAAHHFLRTFDKTFAVFETHATDDDLTELAETRTARAFMLFGRVTGIFD
jgi:hypothetical protein